MPSSSFCSFRMLLVALSLGWLVAGGSTHALGQATAPAAAATVGVPLAPTAVAVSVASLAQVTVQPEREASATVQARNVSRLASEVPATVLQWSADVGAVVTKGQVLVQLDPRDYELAVQRAQATVDAAQTRLALAQAQLQRSRDLVAQGFFSQEALSVRESEVALAQSEVRSSQAQRATAQRQWSKTTLRAPFSGTVTERLAQVGEAVAAGTVLMVLSENQEAELQAVINPSDVAGLRQARPEFETAGQRYPVRLLRVGAVLTAPARTQSARLGFDPALAQRPPVGSSGTLRWHETAPHLPPTLLVRRGTQLGVFVQQGPETAARAQFVPVPGAQEGRAVPVPQSLQESPGSPLRLVVRGQEALQDRSPITPTLLPTQQNPR